MGENMEKHQPPSPMGSSPDSADMISRLANLPEIPPPIDFKDGVMARLPEHGVSWWARCRQILGRPKTLSWTFTPYKWGLAVVGFLVCLVLVHYHNNPGEPPDFRSSAGIADWTDGIRLLEMEKFVEARDWFAQHHHRAPGEPALNYYLGRAHLALDQPSEALGYLRQATEIQTHQAEYHFWLGLCHWALDTPGDELASYRRALELDPEYLPAHVYAGHNYMDRRQWEAALSHYQRVLKSVPDHREALFNSGLALRKLNRIDQENDVWRAFLALYPQSPQALEVVRLLNINGDFTYRAHLIGDRRKVLRVPQFHGEQCHMATEDLGDLNTLGAQLLSHVPSVNLHIVGYVEGNKDLARCRVRTIKGYLLRNFPELPAEAIRLSWFGVPERIIQGDITRELDASVQIFTMPVNLNRV